MAVSAHDIERIVREVLAQLASPRARPDGLGVRPSGSTISGATAGLPGSAKNTVASTDLVVSSRVVTLADLNGRLPAIRRLVVPPQAVVTPAARDELRRRNVTLVFGCSETPQTAPIRLFVVTAGGRFDPAPLLSTVRAEGVDVEPHALDCLIASTDLLAGEIAAGDALGLLLTRHTAAGLCLANRHRGVRAVSGTEPGAIAAATASVGANLLVVDPVAMSLFQMKRTVGEYCQTGIRPCPEVFREELS